MNSFIDNTDYHNGVVCIFKERVPNAAPGTFNLVLKPYSRVFKEHLEAATLTYKLSFLDVLYLPLKKLLSLFKSQ